MAHRGRFFEGDDALDQRFRNGLGATGFAPGVYVSHFDGNQQGVAAIHVDFETQARSTDLRGSDGYREFVIVASRVVKLCRCGDGEQIGAGRVQILRISNSNLAQVLGETYVGVDEIVWIENDALRVDFGPAHAQVVREAKSRTRRGRYFDAAFDET